VIGCAQTQKKACSWRNELACHLNFFQRRAVQHLDRTVVTQTLRYGIRYQRMILFQASQFLRMVMQSQESIAEHI